MGKRLLSSPKKRSPKKKAAGSSKHLSSEKKSAGTVSVADLFLKQNKTRTSVERIEDKLQSEVEVLDISDSPSKAGPSVKNSPTESPYFSSVNYDGTSSSRVKSIPARKVWTKLSLKRSLKSESSGLQTDSQLSVKATITSGTDGQEEIQSKTDTQIPEKQEGPDKKMSNKSRLSLGKRKRISTSTLSSGDIMKNSENDEATEIAAKKEKLEDPGERNLDRKSICRTW